MAKQLDLEEQEQLDELKHFWREYGNLITWALIAVFGAIAAWNGWQYWQNSQAAQASAMYDEIERAVQAGDTDRLERAFSDLKERFGRTTYAQQAGLLAATTLQAKGKADAAKATLAWVAEKSPDEGYQALARLRLAGVMLEAKAYDDALKQLAGNFPPEFAPLAADRRGDVLSLQGKKAEARAEYEKAYKAFDERSDYRRLIEVKLGALGVDAKQLAAPGTAAGAKS
ncbi:tetratricopeptide repeat protein [Ramlibacter sp. RBP-2]|uniref:Ancillary SecYEG translocon subunit n=1 Tax=Ramlibacter lithotrophicus TaxID=2606681 RepID=A0A7X6DBZ9_9BURK|nr:tetratricopeptide repeat protein [Ramlibacter lithotrophicus]NKE64364.1 tetratricopeptide repeat protein [Ramlibacter lithotrophicus]